jgi:hypothetical protein
VVVDLAVGKLPIGRRLVRYEGDQPIEVGAQYPPFFAGHRERIAAPRISPELGRLERAAFGSRFAPV